ncbi:MAG: phosphoribosylamine--glycine ligase [Planctomycetes bacterium]|nr:phosphoribosylamine--glycine ligase [Planctomycetota bacterium]
MKILVVGSGGREHALAWKIAKSPLADRVLCAPGNAGTALVAENRAVAADDADGLSQLVKDEAIDLVVIGPEAPLVAGLADRLREQGVAVFGPGAPGAQLEGSKIFSKNLMRKHGVPTGSARWFDDVDEAREYLRDAASYPLVIKADGLAAGKGVVLPESFEDASAAVESMMVAAKFGDAGRRVLVEEFLRGRELSVLALTDGRTLVVLEPAQDFKRMRDGDQGPNTGGMGSFCPAPAATPEMMTSATREVLVRTVHAMAREGIEYRGCLYAGLMATRSGPKVIEFNCRFGDPETQAVLVRLQSDLVPYLHATAIGKLGDLDAPVWDPRPSVCVVIASAGYPESSARGESILGLEAAGEVPDTVVFHAATSRVGDRVLTAGGRVLGVTALGDDVEAARKRAYEAVAKIRFPGMQYRTDIAAALPPGASPFGAGGPAIVRKR